jgi:DNA-binding XRE family transcriptional regulator
MEDVANTTATAGGDNGASGASTGFTAPPEWAEVETYKPFFVEKDGTKSFDVQALAKSYADVQTKIPVVPAKADDYKAELPKDFPMDEVDVKLQKELAKNLGLTQAQYEGIVKHDLSRFTRVADEMAKTVEAAKATLTKEWGGPQKFDANLAMARKAADVFFGKDVFKDHDLGNDPALIKGLYMIATKLSEDTLKSGMGAGAADRVLGEYGTPILPSYLKTTPGPKNR